MTSFRSALLAAALLCCGCDGLTTRPAEYRPQEAGTVDQALCLLGFTGIALREAPTGHHLVDVELNGVSGVFVLDTGANLSVLDTRYVERFGLEPRSSPLARAFGIGGGQNVALARVETMRIGGVDIRQGRIAVANVSQVADVLGPLTGEDVHGIIGQDVLAEHRAVIDVARPILHIIEADEDPAPVPLEQCAVDGEAASAEE
jgi:hypothetical protein